MRTAILVAPTVLALALLAPLGRAQGTIRAETYPGGVLFVVKDRSGLVTNDSPLYLASNHGGWDPGRADMRLSGRSDLRWQILLPGPIGDPALEFKFTRGSWDTVEVAPDLSDIANRTLPSVVAGSVEADKPIVVEFEIEHFADQRAGAERARPGDDSGAPLRVTGKAVRLQVIGGAGAAVGAMRDVVVWLPPGYDDPANADWRYPVLYMQDGQNVFDSRPPTPGEWGADETATQLIESGEMEPIIIAAIPNSGANRRVEYLPARALGVEGQGDAYIDWMVREVVPRVERAFRASRDPAARGIGGSSLGGLIALRAAQRYPDVFGRVLAESPALVLPDGDLGESMFGDVSGWHARTFIGMGSKEFGEGEADRNAAWVASARAMAEKITAAAGAREAMLLVTPDAPHTERSWAARLPEALKYLYPPRD